MNRINRVQWPYVPPSYNAFEQTYNAAITADPLFGTWIRDRYPIRAIFKCDTGSNNVFGISLQFKNTWMMNYDLAKSSRQSLDSSLINRLTLWKYDL